MRLRSTEHGRMVWSDPGSDKPLREVGTLQCCHCGGHFPVQPGSGKTRGFCRNCMGPLCGKEACFVCVPQEQQLENIEHGRPWEHRPVIVSFASAESLSLPGEL